MTTATDATQLPTAGTEDDDKGGAALDLGHEVTPKAPGAAAAPAAPASAPAQTAAAETDEDGGKGGGGIPRARMNEVVRQREAAQAEAAELRRENERLRAVQSGAAPAGSAAAAAPAPAAQAFDVDAAEDQYMQALMDGDVKAARELRGKINAHTPVGPCQPSTALSILARSARTNGARRILCCSPPQCRQVWGIAQRQRRWMPPG